MDSEEQGPHQRVREGKVRSYAFQGDGGSGSRLSLAGVTRQTPVPRSIVKAPIHFPQLPSPASIQSCRIAVKGPGDGTCCDAFVASGDELFHVKVPLGEGVLQQGKASLLVPVPVEGASTTPLYQLPHRSEIQAVSLRELDDGALLGSVDSHGRAVVSLLHSGESGSRNGSFEGSWGSAYTVTPPASSSEEAGWAGLAFCPKQPSMVAIARHYARQLDVYDRDVHVRTFHTSAPCPG